MQLQLETLAYQQEAIQAVANLFDGTKRNTFDNATFENIRANVLALSAKQIFKQALQIAADNGIDANTSKPEPAMEFCIEMETGTGKTLVYIQTIYELHRRYGFTKFIILVPSVPIREGVLATLKQFERQLESIYGFRPTYFEYESKRLNKVLAFVEEQRLQIMVMTLASFNSDDRILNQEERETLFGNEPLIKALARTRPIIMLDEPQEGMDTENSVARIATLNPLAKFRYSATHKKVVNLLYRLTPYDSYKQGLVKKIEALTVVEKNDEATLKIELTEIQNGKGDPKAKLKAWKANGDGYKFSETRWLKVGDRLDDVTGNPSYNDYMVTRIWKGLRDGKWHIAFRNGIELTEKQTATNKEAIWRLQLEWLIRRHFQKAARLRPQGIKCLSLIFIDRVANYMSDNGVIKRLFAEEYARVFAELNEGALPTAKHVTEAQGFYFSQTGKGEFTDSEASMRSNREIYDTILNQKEQLLSLGEPIEFIFSHSALGVGWDNPNVFNIATLNESYSDVKKRQEIGRGLRICVNQHGQRVYDKPDARDDERINQLTVVPNETYETFAAQYQAQIKEVYGDTRAGAEMTHTHKGEVKNRVKFKRSAKNDVNAAFKRFWQRLARKTEYSVFFDEKELIQKAAEQITAEVNIGAYTAEVTSRIITDVAEAGMQATNFGVEQTSLRATFASLDLVEQLSDAAHISLRTTQGILANIVNLDHAVRNPLVFVHEASKVIRRVALDEMMRGLTYHLTGERFDDAIVPADFEAVLRNDQYVHSPKQGLWDNMLTDSFGERLFSQSTDNDPDVVCFLKLPAVYVINTPAGEYHPDWGIVLKHKRLRDGDEAEFYFVIETKGTNDLFNTKDIRESERQKILCAIKHFEALGVPVTEQVDYIAPVKDYKDKFRKDADSLMNQRHG